MYLLLPIVLSAVFVGLRAWTDTAFSGLYRRKQCQIAADNALFRIGRLDRELFERVSKVEQQLHPLHVSHHALHACARNPLTALKCSGPDKALELKVESFFLASEAAFQGLWSQNQRTAGREWHALEVKEARFSRAQTVPLARVRCSVCGLHVRWDRLWEQASTSVVTCGSEVPAYARLKWPVETKLPSALGKKWQTRPRKVNYQWVQ